LGTDTSIKSDGVNKNQMKYEWKADMYLNSGSNKENSLQLTDR